MDNYPDDIRQYDDDPRSPFYNQPTCFYCGEDVHDDEVCPCQEVEENELANE